MPSSLNDRLHEYDFRIATWMYKYGKPLLRFSLSIVFIWFGYLKIIGESPAQELVSKTVSWLDPLNFPIILGYWEVAIGVLLCFRPTIRIAILLLALQIPGTFLPLVILPELTFDEFPLILSMQGQYIVKNLVIISAAIVVGSTVREREMVKKDLTSADY